MLAPEFFIPMRSLTALFHVAMTGLSAADNILNFLESPENKISGSIDFPKISDVNFNNFNFSYPDGKKALNNINISFKQNNLTAIVGHSGCGKSTLASILAGELQAKEKNKIKINDIVLNEIKNNQIPKNILKITHDGHVFEGSLRENLKFAKPDASDEEIIEVLEQVKLWDLFKTRKGLDSTLNSQGKNLSGGQAQRISLARALLYNASIYIFDEATSNIDVESEEIILDIIYNLSKTKTVIFISHRLASIKNADIIYVMEKGNIIESGKHTELLKESKIYKYMYTQQEELENYLRGGRENAK